MQFSRGYSIPVNCSMDQCTISNQLRDPSQINDSNTFFLSTGVRKVRTYIRYSITQCRSTLKDLHLSMFVESLYTQNPDRVDLSTKPLHSSFHVTTYWEVIKNSLDSSPLTINSPPSCLKNFPYRIKRDFQFPYRLGRLFRPQSISFKRIATLGFEVGWVCYDLPAYDLEQYT